MGLKKNYSDINLTTSQYIFINKEKTKQPMSKQCQEVDYQVLKEDVNI